METSRQQHPLPPRDRHLGASTTRVALPPRARQPHRVTVQKIFRRQRTVVILTLSGHWLSHLGFTARQSVTVTAEPGKIVLSLASPPREDEP